MRIYSGGPLQIPERTIPQMLFDVAKRYPDGVAFRSKEAGRYTDYTYRQITDQVRTLANGFMSLGVGVGDKVAILSETRMEWSLADYASLAAGGVAVTVYPTLTAEQVGYLLNDSTTKVLVVENQEQFDKVKEVAKDLKSVEHFVTIEEVADKGTLEKQTITWQALLEGGRTHATQHANAVDERLAAVEPDDVATLVYTSGTTGTPKGAILTHKNFMSAARAAQKALDYHDRGSSVMFLPLAHCYGRLLVFLLTDLGGTVAFSSPRTLGDDLRLQRPTIVASVPRLYERMYDQILNAVAEQPPNKQKIFNRAVATAKEMGKAREDGGTPGFGLRLRWALFDRLVYSKLREKLGMTNLKIGITGAAAIRPDLLYFFQGIGVNILEGYGLTETSAPSNANKPSRFRPGRVGPPFPGMEQRLGEDGEVLMRGPNVFKGYYNLEKETAEAFTDDGWFRTGDIGEFDSDGYLKIVDRKKELEILDTGKNVAPVVVEETLKTVSPFVSEAIAIGQGQKYIATLIQPNFDRLVMWAKEQNIAFDESKIVIAPDPTGTPMTYSVGDDLLANEKVVAFYKGEVAKANQKLAQFEQIKEFRFANHAFTMDRDELTPTLKKKRRIIKANYQEIIDTMFQKK